MAMFSQLEINQETGVPKLLADPVLFVFFCCFV